MLRLGQSLPKHLPDSNVRFAVPHLKADGQNS